MLYDSLVGFDMLFAVHSPRSRAACGLRPFPRERQGQPSVNAEKHHKECLHGVDDEHKIEGVVGPHAVKDEHCLHGKMPRARPVGRGHDDGNAAHNECDQCAHHAKTRCGLEAKEGEIVVEEVAAPNGQCEENEERHVFHIAQRHHALPDAAERVFHLIIYGEFLHQKVEEHGYGHAANGRHEVADSGEPAEQTVDIGAGGAEKGEEDGDLQHERDGRYHHDEQRINGALGDNSAQSLGKRNVVPSLQHAATRKFAYAWHYQTHGVGKEYGVDGCRETGMFVYRFEGLPPSPAPEKLGRNAERKGEKHPCPVHLMEKDILHAPEIESPIHPVEYGPAQQERQRYFQSAV